MNHEWILFIKMLTNENESNITELSEICKNLSAIKG